MVIRESRQNTELVAKMIALAIQSEGQTPEERLEHLLDELSTGQVIEILDRKIEEAELELNRRQAVR